MNVEAEVARILTMNVGKVDVDFGSPISVGVFAQFVAAFAQQGIALFASAAQWTAMNASDATFSSSSFIILRESSLEHREDATAEEELASQQSMRSSIEEARRAQTPRPSPGQWKYHAFKSSESIAETAEKLGVLPQDEFVQWTVKPYGTCAIVFW